MVSQRFANLHLEVNQYLELWEPSSDIKLRVLVAGLTCPIRPLSELLDKILKTFILHVKSYARGNIDFTERCSKIAMKTQF